MFNYLVVFIPVDIIVRFSPNLYYIIMVINGVYYHYYTKEEEIINILKHYLQISTNITTGILIVSVNILVVIVKQQCYINRTIIHY